MSKMNFNDYGRCMATYNSWQNGVLFDLCDQIGDVGKVDLAMFALQPYPVEAGWPELVDCVRADQTGNHACRLAGSQFLFHLVGPDAHSALPGLVGGSRSIEPYAGLHDPTRSLKIQRYRSPAVGRWRRVVYLVTS